MSVANSKKTAPVHGFEWAGAVAHPTWWGFVPVRSPFGAARRADLGIRQHVPRRTLGRDTRHKRPHLNTTVEYETPTAGPTALSLVGPAVPFCRRDGVLPIARRIRCWPLEACALLA